MFLTQVLLRQRGVSLLDFAAPDEGLDDVWSISAILNPIASMHGIFTRYLPKHLVN